MMKKLVMNIVTCSVIMSFSVLTVTTPTVRNEIEHGTNVSPIKTIKLYSDNPGH